MDVKFKDVVRLVQKLPGIGPRHATRIVMGLLDRPQSDLDELSGAIRELKD